jgi:hypothetical protein
MGARPLSRVELMLWLRGDTIKWYQSIGYDSEESMKFRFDFVDLVVLGFDL